MRNIKLNLLKGLACIGVIFIHVGFPSTFGEIVLRISSYAVPIFFMIAGYYAFGKDTEVIKRRLVKIVKIFICAYIVFFIWKISVAIKNNEVGLWFSWYYSWKTPIRMVVFCIVDFGFLLWYLIEMIEIYLFWILIVKKGKEGLALKALPVLWIIRLILISVNGVIGFDKDWYMLFVIKGMPWFLLGYYLHSPKSEKIRNLRSSYHWLLAMVGCIIVVLPTFINSESDFFEFGYIPYAVGLFCLTLRNPEESNCKLIEYIGEKLSLYVYVLHLPVAGAYVLSVEIVGINKASSLFLWTKPLVVLLLTLAASYIISKIVTRLKR